MDAPSLLTVLARWDHHRATLVLRGELDITTAPQALALLAETLGKNPRSLTLDVAELTFMDTQGVKLIARARQGMPAGSDVVIRRPNASVHRVLTITGIDRLCTIDARRLPPLPGGVTSRSAS